MLSFLKFAFFSFWTIQRCYYHSFQFTGLHYSPFGYNIKLEQLFYAEIYFAIFAMRKISTFLYTENWYIEILVDSIHRSTTWTWNDILENDNACVILYDFRAHHSTYERLFWIVAELGTNQMLKSKEDKWDPT